MIESKNMLKAFRASANQAQQLDSWLQKNHDTVESVARMQADDGTIVYILKFSGTFKPNTLPGFGTNVTPIPLPNFNIEVRDLDEIDDILQDRYEGSIGAETISDFIKDIVRSGRPAVIKTKNDGNKYLLYLKGKKYQFSLINS